VSDSTTAFKDVRDSWLPNFMRVAFAATGVLCMMTCSPSDPSQSDILFVKAAPHVPGEFRIAGALEAVSVSPDGRIWLASATGQIAVADSVHGSWRSLLGGDTRETWPSAIEDWGTTLDRVSFFTPDTAVATGLGIMRSPYEIGDSYALLRTTNGGERWDTVAYNGETPITAVFTNERGEGWIGGLSDGTLLFTKDFGATWTDMPPPFDSRTSSIDMANAPTGVVAGLWNRLALTTDAGRTWTPLTTPFDQGLVPEDSPAASHMLTDVAMLPDRLVVRQGGLVFVTRRDSIAWARLPGEARYFAYDHVGGRLYGLNSRNEVILYDDALQARRLGGGVVRAKPQHMAVRGDGVVILDREGALYEVTSQRTAYSFPLSDKPNRRIRLARLHGDRIWGVTHHHIYHSDDRGATWTRSGFTPTAIRGFLVRTDETLLLWDGNGRNLLFDPAAGSLRPLESLRGYDVVDILTLGSTWIAFGGRQYETMGRVEVGRYFPPGQFEGTRENGFVLMSEDEGERWKRVDEWAGGGVANVHVDPVSREMILVSYLGGVRRLTPGRRRYVAEDLILPNEDTWNRVPYVEVPSVVYFEDSRRGFIDGWIHHLGERKYMTTDGGRTWARVNEPLHDIRSIATPYGYVVLRGSEYDGGLEVALLRGSVRRSLWSPEVPHRRPDEYPWGGITDVSVDVQGRILVVVDEDEFVVLDDLLEPLNAPHRERR
jgi:photosystem II stability/assembly factor-like uncharacterized protein